jgi:twitching motility protein PilT
MIANSAIRNSIREGQTQYLRNAIQLGLREKMQTLNQALAKLVLEQRITRHEALLNSVDREQLVQLIGIEEYIQKPVSAY